MKLTLIRSAVTTALDAEAVRPGRVHILISDDAELRRLNREFRMIDRPTDVLTFPAPEELPDELGDIAISHEFILRGAADRGVSPSQEAAALALHGALHLAGWEDADPGQARAMMERMAELAPLAGLRSLADWASQPH
jgi:rRNA maturation RNase YbeY